MRRPPPGPYELDCGHPPTATRYAFTNGVARTAGGWTMCYRCAYDDQVVDLLVRDSIYAYIASGPSHHLGPGGGRLKVTTWPSEVLGTVLCLHFSRPRCSRHGDWRMRYIRVRDLHGQMWAGRGSDQYDVIRLRRITGS
ncbi:hypothetical protein DFJ69_6043 [Thermomonospora umbrina]|uniref:Uncharacterized protein n=1 Tax=Thermomonospora umbrina TaxID=111806 RepID=A0A3D9SXC9_9ACTN|nr:hypothetical protein DFJ69_6043 [Thermomonospora umbrina]